MRLFVHKFSVCQLFVPSQLLATLAEKREKRKEKREEWWEGHPHPFRSALLLDEYKYDVFILTTLHRPDLPPLCKGRGTA